MTQNCGLASRSLIRCPKIQGARPDERAEGLLGRKEQNKPDMMMTLRRWLTRLTTSRRAPFPDPVPRDPSTMSCFSHHGPGDLHAAQPQGKSRDTN